MLFMNEYEVEQALLVWAGHPVLGPATMTLASLVNATNRNSDGWPYYSKPCQAANKLIEFMTSRMILCWGVVS